MDDNSLDELQEKLTEEAIEDEQPDMKVDNRSIYTIKEQIQKKTDVVEKPEHE